MVMLMPTSCSSPGSEDGIFDEPLRFSGGNWGNGVGTIGILLERLSGSLSGSLGSLASDGAAATGTSSSSVSDPAHEGSDIRDDDECSVA